MVMLAVIKMLDLQLQLNGYVIKFRYSELNCIYSYFDLKTPNHPCHRH